MRVTMFFNGGPNYACFDTHDRRDAEEFTSLQSAIGAFRDRLRGHPDYPCVENPEAWICKGTAKQNLGIDWPDYILSTGPRGGILRQRT